MLLIPDIHINAKHARAILHELSTYIDANPDETDIIFLGDYMYMFSYDRQALSDLLDLFLAQRHAGKNVYVLAGNHDWLGQHFIYHEGKKLADILNRTALSQLGKNQAGRSNVLRFITEPETITIQGQHILFLPYNKSFLAAYADTARDRLVNQRPTDVQRDSVLTQAASLLTSTNTNEQLSGSLNTYIAQQLATHAHTTPIDAIIHHYYMAEVKLPGQEAIFHYRDVALDPQRATFTPPACRTPLLVSGHIHKAFVYHNYLCTGSVRYTTSGERDHAKRLWKRTPIATGRISGLSETHVNGQNSQNQANAMSSLTSPDIQSGAISHHTAAHAHHAFHATQVTINPYIARGDATPLSTAAVCAHFSAITTQDTNLRETTRAAHITLTHDAHPLTPSDIQSTTVIIYTQQSATQIEAAIDDTTKQAFADIQLKHRSASNQDMSELLDISQYNIQQSLTDWKELAKKYILSIYQDQSDKYYKELSDLGIF